MVRSTRLQPPEGTPFYWLIVTAGSGEANTMTVTALGNGLAIRDSTTPVQVADANCAAISPYEATCSPPARFQRVKVDLGDRDDALLVAAPLPTELSGADGNDRLGYQGAFGALMQGDSGDDVLEGGDGADQLLGGAGSDALRGAGGNDQLHVGGEPPDDDLMDGGPGNDDLVYDIRRNVVVDLLAGVAGGAGERDRFTGIEGVATAGGDDLITGSDRAERIATGGGNDRISSGAGDDNVNSGPGSDRVSAGAGADIVDTGANPFQLPRGPLLQPPDVVRCGPGRDRIESVAPRDLLGRDCEYVTARSTSVPAKIRARPVRIDRRSVTFRVPCAKPADALCSGALALQDRGGRSLGRRAFRIKPRRHRDVRVKLAGRPRRLLRRPGGATVRVHLGYEEGRGRAGPYEVSWSIKVRLPG